jgi:hypothetical protein
MLSGKVFNSTQAKRVGFWTRKLHEHEAKENMIYHVLSTKVSGARAGKPAPKSVVVAHFTIYPPFLPSHKSLLCALITKTKRTRATKKTSGVPPYIIIVFNFDNAVISKGPHTRHPKSHSSSHRRVVDGLAVHSVSKKQKPKRKHLRRTPKT